MWMEKLAGGVLRVLTPLGPRYFYPSFAQRVYLLWIFRNFETLPVKVLTPREVKFIDSICDQPRNAFSSSINSLQDAPILGTLEQRPPVDADSSRRPNESVSDDVRPFAADRQR
jgi:hypothetical protein